MENQSVLLLNDQISNPAVGAQMAYVPMTSLPAEYSAQHPDEKDDDVVHSNQVIDRS